MAKSPSIQTGELYKKTTPLQRLLEFVGRNIGIWTLIGGMIVVILFLWTFHNDVVKLSEKVGFIEGQQQTAQNCSEKTFPSRRYK